MKKSTLLIFVSLFFAFSLSVKAQNDSPENKFVQPARRGNLMRRLGLSKEQIQQIRRLNASRKPLERDAKQRLNEARQNLDKAVYADFLDEAQVQAGILELQQAQADLIKIKVSNELEIRKILTAEQLIKFRQLREQFDNRREERLEQRRNRQKILPNRRGNRQSH